ncbi:MAG: hypothetical protein EBT55_06355, partial [Proteobacteria bacterium]|nr:hypothetical protein [Pseudomonadota bacterium]
IPINDIASSCSTAGINCFLIPSVENVDWQDKFMPSWKATTSKSSATATGGLQISAGSKVEIEATGQITLGSSEEKVCHKNITSYNPNLYEETSGSCSSTPKIFNFAANTKYQPNVKIISIPAPLSSKYTLYRSLTTTEKGNITHNNPNYNDLCKSFCYIKIMVTTPLSVANFACDASVPEIKSVPSSTNCKYSGSTITTQYDSAKEQVRIANYAKKVIIDSLATSVEDVNVASYTPPTLAQPFPPSSTNIEKTYPYSDLKTEMPTSYNSPLLVYFDNFNNCEINVRIQTDATNFRDVYQDLGRPLKPEGNAINVATFSIVYPGATLYLKKTNGNCSNLTITPYPYIEFTAMQSGFIDFKSANTCQLKQTRVVNNNINYPRRKAKTEDGGTTWKWVQAYNDSYRHNIVPGNSFVDVLLNKIFNIYQSFAASPVVTIPPEGI